MNNDNKDNFNKVTMMTIMHKRIRICICLYIGLEENLFPSQLSVNSREDLEEERRLFYVALTRAKKKFSFLMLQADGDGVN